MDRASLRDRILEFDQEAREVGSPPLGFAEE